MKIIKMYCEIWYESSQLLMPSLIVRDYLLFISLVFVIVAPISIPYLLYLIYKSLISILT